jgi:hypothetical protein
MSFQETEFYELESFDEQMRFLLRYAVLAPSTRNTQPWQFGITKDGVEVFADYTRRLRIIDPDDRELLMSVGAAITNFRVAAAHFCFDTTVLYETRPEEGVPVALISVTETCAPDRKLSAPFSAIPKRHTNRGLFDGEPLEPQAVTRLCDTLDRFPETFRLLLPRDRSRAGAMVEQAERAQMARPAFRAEIADWIRTNDDERTDGFPAEALGVPRVLATEASWIVREFDLGAAQGRRNRRLAESASALLVVTAEDDRVSLIRAGEALEFLLLTMTDAGLQYSFLNQPVEVEATRDRIAAMAGTTHPPQLLLRIGSAPTVGKPTPRRPLETVIASSR